MKTIETFPFHPTFAEAQRDALVLALRRAGFTASRETASVRTDATRAQILLTWGRGGILAREDRAGIAPGCAVQVVGGKYDGCILTFVRWQALGPVVLIDRMERTLESTAGLRLYRTKFEAHATALVSAFGPGAQLFDIGWDHADMAGIAEALGLSWQAMQALYDAAWGERRLDDFLARFRPDQIRS